MMALTASSRLRSSIHSLALGMMPNAEAGMVRNTTRDTSVSTGCLKNQAMSGAQKKRMTYMENPAKTLNQKTAL